jgi:hypothetical protein
LFCTAILLCLPRFSSFFDLVLIPFGILLSRLYFAFTPFLSSVFFCSFVLLFLFSSSPSSHFFLRYRCVISRFNPNFLQNWPCLSLASYLFLASWWWWWCGMWARDFSFVFISYVLSSDFLFFSFFFFCDIRVFFDSFIMDVIEIPFAF